MIPSTGCRHFVFSAHPPSGMIKYRPTVHCPHIGYAIPNALSPYTNPGDSPSGGGMCVKRDVCIPSRSQPSIALIYFISISPKQPKSCTQGPSCRWHWVRRSRNPQPPSLHPVTLWTLFFMISHEPFHEPWTLTSNSTIFDNSCTLQYP